MRPGQETEFEAAGRTFKIRKFNPETACFWAYKMLGDLAFQHPEGLAGQLKSFIQSCDRKQFRDLQRDCLAHVLLKMESGIYPLMDEQGFLIVNDVPNDVVFELMFTALNFSMKDFFAQSRGDVLMLCLLQPFLTTGTEGSSSSPSASGDGDNAKPGTEPTPSPTYST